VAWQKANPAIIEMLAAAISRYDCDRRFMFGSPTFFINNNMFAGVFEDSVILRLSESDRREILAADDEVKPFTPMPGRPMKEYVAFPESFTADAGVFREWLDRSYRYAASLPYKELKRPRQGK